MNVQQFDLSATALDDGTVRLKQRDYAGDEAIVDLHPAQLRHIAVSAGLIDAEPAWPPGFARALLRIRKEAAALADMLGAIPCFPPQAGMTADEQAAHDLWENISDLMVEHGLAEAPDAEPTTTEPPNHSQQLDMLDTIKE